MKLELAEFPVKQIRLGHRFSFKDRVSSMSMKARFSDLGSKRLAYRKTSSLAVVGPGEKVRITGIRDMVEPRTKVSGGGQVFPGVLSTDHRMSAKAEPIAFPA